jgi:hypothetical protein
MLSLFALIPTLFPSLHLSNQSHPLCPQLRSQPDLGAERFLRTDVTVRTGHIVRVDHQSGMFSTSFPIPTEPSVYVFIPIEFYFWILHEWPCKLPRSELRCWTIPSSYSEGLDFKSGLGDYSEWGVYGVSSVHPGKCQPSTLNWVATALLPYPLQFVIYLIILQFDNVWPEPLKTSKELKRVQICTRIFEVPTLRC